MYTHRKRSNVISAGFFAIAAHAIIIGLFFIQFDWDQKKPMQVAQVTLWDSLPQPIPEPPPTEDVVVPEEKVEPPPPPVVKEKLPVVEPEKKPEVKNDIAIAKKKEQEKLEKQKKEKLEKAKKKKLAAKKKREKKKAEALKKKKLLAQLQKDITKKKPNKEALKKLQQNLVDEQNAAKAAKAAKAQAAVNAGIVDQYIAKIQNKVRGHVNRSLCGDGDPILTFKVSLLPTGDLIGAPKLVKSSGITVCDEAVERAIQASQPFPLPEDRSLISKFRNLKLTFEPNQ
jgi:colicin import membrane protein